MTAQESALALFTAGILPSILIGIVDAVYVFVYSHIKMVPLLARARWDNIWATTKEAGWAIGTIVVIFGGIYGGMFTPTEAAGVAVIYSLFVTTVDLSRARPRRSVARAGQLGVPDFADPDHRRRRRALLLAADHQRHSAACGQRGIEAPAHARRGRRCC